MEYEGIPIPPGFKFLPTDQEVIIHYLRPKVNGLPLPWDEVKEYQVYGDRGIAPWEILKPDPNESVHFFTMSINRSAERKIRTCKDFGTWMFQCDHDIRDVVGDRRRIGTKALLTFDPRNSNIVYSEANLGGHWNMHEYSLPGSRNIDCLVFCTISFRLSRGADLKVVINKFNRYYLNHNNDQDDLQQPQNQNDDNNNNDALVSNPASSEPTTIRPSFTVVSYHNNNDDQGFVLPPPPTPPPPPPTPYLNNDSCYQVQSVLSEVLTLLN